MKTNCRLLFVALACLVAFACDREEEELPGTLYGVVTDKATGEPIRSAGVELSPVGSKTITGTEGQFEFTELTPGQYTLLVTKTGYLDYASSTIEVKPAQTAQSDVQMELLPPALKVVDDNRQEISALDFGAAEGDVARSFNIFNDGVEPLEWQLTKTAEWIAQVSKTEGELKAGATQALIVTIDRSKLAEGANTTTLHITSNSGSKQLTVNATNGTVLATLNTLDVSDVKSTSAILHGEMLTDGDPKYSERGFVYGTSSMPTVDNAMRKLTVTLTDKKTFSATATGLTSGQTYYVRAYAVNAGKAAYSSNEVSFTPDMALPVVVTREVSNQNLAKGMASLNGTITDAGDPAYTERGFVYGTMHNPTVDGDTKVVASGSGTGDYSLNVSDLANEVYYVRAYATNEKGTAYGEEVVLNMDIVPATLRTLDVSGVKSTSAQFHGEIVAEGNPAYTERGFVYATSSMPTWDNAVQKLTVAMTGDKVFSATATGLTSGQTYYVRAYAVNAGEAAYSMNEVAFTPVMTLPVVSTRTVSEKSISTGMASLNGTITDAGDPAYTERGFVYGTMHNPTVDSDTKVVVSGGGTGDYSINLSGLVMGTVYYVRAYATNERGTAYGEEVTLDMNAVMPGVVTGEVDIKEASIVFNGTITEVGDPAYTERGFVYGTMLVPLLDNGATKAVADGTIPGAFNAEVTDLTGKGTFRVRAYAISPAGVEYGEVEQFMFDEAYFDLPTFKHGGQIYRVYPDLGDIFDWDEANALCENLTYAGYDDWMLPSKDVLMTMYLYKDEIGGFKEDEYWSSTPGVKVNGTESYDHYYVDFVRGELARSYNISFSVRPVRLER